jgi:hypothetical protein
MEFFGFYIFLFWVLSKSPVPGIPIKFNVECGAFSAVEEEFLVGASHRVNLHSHPRRLVIYRFSSARVLIVLPF